MPRFHFKYPSVNSVIKLSPKERVAYISEKFQKYLKKLTVVIGDRPFQIIGTKKKPRGIEIQADRKTLKAIQGQRFTQSHPTSQKSRKQSEPYFCFKLIFEIQIEGKERGIQTIEERYVLVKAKTWALAELKVKQEFKKPDLPYLNPYGQLVRWRLESIEESYHTFIESRKDFNRPVEVFSKLKTRRMKPKNAWNGER